MKKQKLLAVFALCITVSLALFAGAITLDYAEASIESAEETATLAADTVVYVDASSVYTLPEGTVVTSIDLGNTNASYNEANGTITGAGYAGTVVVTTDSGNITVNFRGATKWIPGLNILTGTTDSYEVETDESAALTFVTDKTGTTRGAVSVTADPVAENASNSVLKLERVTGQNSITVYTKNDFESISVTRPVQIVIGYNNPGYDTYCLVNGTTNRQYKSMNLTTDTEGLWEYKSIGKGVGIHSSVTGNNIDSISCIGFQFGPGGPADSAPAYIDKIAMIPYYEITYVMSSGSNVTDYVLYDSSANLLTSYTVKADITDERDGMVFLGWSTEYDATTPMTSIPLNYEDITLYPVFSDSSIISTKTIYASVDETATVTVIDTSADITWEFIPGVTEATFDKATYTVTGSGYAGTTTVKATANNITEEVDIVFVGTKKWKPGLNILTSNTESFSLDKDYDIAKEQFALLFTHDDRADASVESNPLDIMAGNVIKLSPASGKTYPYMYFKTAFDNVIEKERPVEFKYSYYGDRPTWVNANGRNSKDIYGKAAGTEIKLAISEDDWTSGSFTLTASRRQNNNDVNFFSFVGDMSTSTQYAYLDNLSYIPYYKITYIGLDGETVAATEYVLKDESGNYLSEYTLTRPVEGATSYYLDQELTKQVENDKVTLAYEDIVIYSSVKNEVVYSVDGTVVTKEYTSETVTITKPSEVDAAFADTNFVVWVDTDGEKYYVGETVAATDLAGKALTAYCQDANASAMGYAYEGNYTPAYEKAGYRYTELIEDDGRDVLHIHLWNGMDGKGATFPTDWRVSFRLNNTNNSYTHYDPTEYSIVQYSTKIPEAYKNSNGPVAMSNVNLRLYAQTSTGGVYTNPVINFSGTYSVPVVDEYRIYEFDASGNDNYLAKAGYGFCVDYIHGATYGGDAYIDYLRVYRKGIFTVTYDTNAPEGATVVTNVAADINRGVGTGYMLKDLRPEVEGYIFKGWATKKDATAADAVTTIDLKGDATVYAVWEADTAYKATQPEGTVEIKDLGDTHGIRFYTFTSSSIKQTVNELGFIATRAALLTDENDYSELTFDFITNGAASAAAAKKYAQGIAYKKGTTTDIVNREGTNGEVYYTALTSGIPDSATKEIIVVRPYAKYLLNGKEVTVYGNAMASSVYDAAEAIKAANGEDYANNKDYIDSILG